MNLTDIAPMETWIWLEKEIHRDSGLDVNVFDTKGYRISDFKNWANRLCPEIKATDRGQSFICAPAHMNIAMQAMRSGQPAIEECDAGLIKLVVPIFSKGEFVGAVGACGCLLEDGEVDAFLVNKMTDIVEEKVDEFAREIPSISHEQAQSLAESIVERIAKITGT